jgi:cold shock CspA family protein
MRFDGTLSQWDANRGLGRIRPDQGGQEPPVHISAFPRDRRLCALGDPLSFEVEPACCVFLWASREATRELRAVWSSSASGNAVLIFSDGGAKPAEIISQPASVAQRHPSVK